MPSAEETLASISQRYGGVLAEAMLQVLRPTLIAIDDMDSHIFKHPGQNHYRASFKIALTPDNRRYVVPGMTGKFVPRSYVDGGVWQELAKGRILSLDADTGKAEGEIYTGGPKRDLEAAVKNLTTDDYLEVDQYGTAAKFLSGLTECTLALRLESEGYTVTRMPEDVAKHIGQFHDFDFEVRSGTDVRKIEVKSLWGTNTRYARLIHSLGKRYPTSSCKFETQDIFAVSLFLRTGNINDFGFARSVPDDEQSHGLPRSSEYPEHVNQNPLCEIGAGVWFDSIQDVWDLS